MLYTRYTFRELQTPAELEAMFRLRFREFSKLPWYAHLLENAKNGLDIDQFDARSRHFGLFKKDIFGNEKLIGGLRVILNETNFAVARLLEHRGWLPENPVAEPGLFCFHEYFKNAEQHLGHFSQLLADHCEPGRLVLDAGHRSFGLANFMSKSITAVVCSMDIGEAIVTGRSFLVPFYKRMGFRLVAQHEDAGFPPIALMRMDRKMAFAAVPNLSELIKNWEENAHFSSKISRFGLAELRFLWKKTTRSFFKKTTTRTVTSLRPQVQIAN